MDCEKGEGRLENGEGRAETGRWGEWVKGETVKGRLIEFEFGMTKTLYNN